MTDEDVARYFINNKTIDRTPSFLLVSSQCCDIITTSQVDDNGDYQTANADDFYGEKHGLGHWIVSKSVPTVGL